LFRGKTGRRKTPSRPEKKKVVSVDPTIYLVAPRSGSGLNPQGQKENPTGARGPETFCWWNTRRLWKVKREKTVYLARPDGELLAEIRLADEKKRETGARPQTRDDE